MDQINLILARSLDLSLFISHIYFAFMLFAKSEQCNSLDFFHSLYFQLIEKITFIISFKHICSPWCAGADSRSTNCCLCANNEHHI